MGLLRRLTGRADEAPQRPALQATWPLADPPAPVAPAPARTGPVLLAAVMSAEALDAAPGPPGGPAVRAALQACDDATDEASARSAARVLVEACGDPVARGLFPSGPLTTTALIGGLMEDLPPWPAFAATVALAELSAWQRAAPGWEGHRDDGSGLTLPEITHGWADGWREIVVEQIGPTLSDPAQVAQADRTARALAGDPGPPPSA